ncbi:hypothetical protein TNCV_3365381 [Trichonephila clavipes]|nr:hypothetical protein TNCV_3365381 [Trichonephila clavipes]
MGKELQLKIAKKHNDHQCKKEALLKRQNFVIPESSFVVRSTRGSDSLYTCIVKASRVNGHLGTTFAEEDVCLISPLRASMYSSVRPDCFGKRDIMPIIVSTAEMEDVYCNVLL